jgi:peptidoglycan/LPS O-acetylase OafA/YrhL
MADTSHEGYLRRTYFPELDGLRGLCALLVITVHLYSHKEAWAWLAGDRAVTLFFALSGLLITALALREEDKEGRISLGAFFLRRSFRLFPLYYLILAVYVGYVLVLGRGDADQRACLSEALPWYALYFQEVPFFRLVVQAQRDLPFFQTWSLGVEEKFYIFWPLLAFVLWGARRQIRMAGTVCFVGGLTIGLPLLALAGHVQLARYLTSYQAILAGCLLGLLLHQQASYEWLGELARWGGGLPALFLLVALHAASTLTGWPGIVVSVAYPLAAIMVFAGLVRGEGPLAPLFRWSPLVAVGKLSYGVYLVHLLAMAAVYKLFPVGSWTVAGSVLAYLMVAGLSVVIAAVLHFAVEAPLIRVGRGLASGGREPAGAVATPAAHPGVLETQCGRIIMTASPSGHAQGEGVACCPGNTSSRTSSR